MLQQEALISPPGRLLAGGRRCGAAGPAGDRRGAVWLVL